MEWESSLRPGLDVSALAGVVCWVSVKESTMLGVKRLHLRVLASLEEGSDADESDLVIPHDNMASTVWVTWNAEGVLEDCDST